MNDPGMPGDSDFVVVPEELDVDLRCCPNADAFPFKCSACGLPLLTCRECGTLYPQLPDLNVTRTDINHSDAARPSHHCARCGHAFEYFFIWNAAYAVTRGEWRAAGLNELFAPHHDEAAAARHEARGAMAGLKLPQEVFDIPWRPPWIRVTTGGFPSRLQQEAGPKHRLYHRPAVAIGRRLDDDDVLFYLPGGPAPLAVVHLTYSSRIPEPDPRFPYTTLYDSIQQWVDDLG